MFGNSALDSPVGILRRVEPPRPASVGHLGDDLLSVSPPPSRRAAALAALGSLLGAENRYGVLGCPNEAASELVKVEIEPLPAPPGPGRGERPRPHLAASGLPGQAPRDRVRAAPAARPEPPQRHPVRVLRHGAPPLDLIPIIPSCGIFGGSAGRVAGPIVPAGLAADPVRPGTPGMAYPGKEGVDQQDPAEVHRRHQDAVGEDGGGEEGQERRPGPAVAEAAEAGSSSAGPDLVQIQYCRCVHHPGPEGQVGGEVEQNAEGGWMGAEGGVVAPHPHTLEQEVPGQVGSQSPAHGTEA